jgi:hypothetical protein
MGDPAGEANNGALRLDFDRRLLLRFPGSSITSDAELLAYRELDDTLSLTDTGTKKLAEARAGRNGRHRLAGLMRQAVFGRLASYEDANDAERLCRDPVMRWVVGDRATTGFAASASQMGRFEPKWLSRPQNLAALAELPGQWIDKAQQRRPPRIATSRSRCRGRGAAPNVRGHPGADRAAPGGARVGMRVADQMRQGRRREVRLVIRGAAGFRASAQGYRGFRRLLPAPGAIYGCECALKGRPWSPIARSLRNAG